METENAFVMIAGLTIVATLAYILVLNVDSSLDSEKIVANQQPIAVHFDSGVDDPRHRSNELSVIYFQIEKENELKEFFFEKHTRNWGGKVDGIRFDRFDERLHGSKEFYLSQNEKAKTFVIENS